jgi:hypothetical protein
VSPDGHRNGVKLSGRSYCQLFRISSTKKMK